MTIERPDFSTVCDAQGRDLVPADNTPQEHQQLLADIAASDGPGTPATTTAPIPAERPGSFSNNPDWTDKPPRDAQGRFIAKASDAGIIQSTGLTPEVAEVLAAQLDGMAGAVDSLRDGMTRIWGDAAQDVATWAAELSPAVQAKCAQVILRNPHVRKSELAKRIRQTLTLTEAAEVEAWLKKD